MRSAECGVRSGLRLKFTNSSTAHFRTPKPLHYSLFTPHSSLFTLHSSLFTLHSSLFTIHYSLFTIHYSLFTIHYSLKKFNPLSHDKGLNFLEREMKLFSIKCLWLLYNIPLLQHRHKSVNKLLTNSFFYYFFDKFILQKPFQHQKHEKSRQPVLQFLRHST